MDAFGRLVYGPSPWSIRAHLWMMEHSIFYATLKEKIAAVGARHGWDEKTTQEKIQRTGKILSLDRNNSIAFLLETLPVKYCDIIDKLDEEHPPF